MIHPFFDVRDLFVALLAFGQGEIIAHRRTADGNAAQKRVTSELEQIIRVEAVGEIVACQFRAVATVVGAEIHEIVHRDALGGILVLEKIAEGKSRDETVRQILDEYDAKEQDMVVSDVKKFIDGLLARKLVDASAVQEEGGRHGES